MGRQLFEGWTIKSGKVAPWGSIRVGRRSCKLLIKMVRLFRYLDS